MIEVTGYAGNSVGVFGLGRSGLAVAKSLMRVNAEVLAWDDDSIQRDAAINQKIPVEDLYSTDWSKLSALVLSPGIPLNFPRPHRIVDLARLNGVEIVGDIELLTKANISSKIVGITGTNGKSTSTALTAFVMRASGKEVSYGGNNGKPVMDLPILGDTGFYILELSSYQIDLTQSLSVDIAVLLNLSPDHLDRYDGMNGYIASKKRLFEMQDSSKISILGVDDPNTQELFNDLLNRGRDVIPISLQHHLDNGVYVDDGILYDSRNTTPVRIVDLKHGKLLGKHNWQNAAAAYVISTEFGCDSKLVSEALLEYSGLPHRLEKIAEISGVKFINDSKATNLNAAANALAIYKNIYWIAGGKSKEEDLNSIAHLFVNIRGAFLIGDSAEVFGRILYGTVPITYCENLDNAVTNAFNAAKESGLTEPVVLLSPACASFDQFSDFEERGDVFRYNVELISENL